MLEVDGESVSFRLPIELMEDAMRLLHLTLDLGSDKEVSL